MSRRPILYQSRNRLTGTLTQTINTQHPRALAETGLDRSGGLYAVRCVEHGVIARFDRCRPAGRAIAHVDEWCGECRAMLVSTDYRPSGPRRTTPGHSIQVAFPTPGSRNLTPDDLKRGLALYHEEMKRRSASERKRDADFPLLATRFRRRQPPYFGRKDLTDIIRWKHGDWKAPREAAIQGVASVTDATIRKTTGGIARTDAGLAALRGIVGLASGIGPATASAILAAARPDVYAVIDVFALKALCRYEPEAWHRRLRYDRKGRPTADERVYTDYVNTCRRLAVLMQRATKSPDWTPRRVDMALWGLGKAMASRSPVSTTKDA
jgi:hypothetical protein